MKFNQGISKTKPESTRATQNKLSFSQAIAVCMGKYAIFSGRASRSEYWWFFLFVTLISWVSTIYARAASGFDDPFAEYYTVVVSWVFFVPSIASATRRLHDIGKSGWWQLLWVIPVIGWVPLVIWLAKSTNPNETKYDGDVAQPMWVKLVVVPMVAIPFLLVFLFEVAIAFGTIPDAKVVRGSALNPDTKIDLINNGILRAEEEVLYFYTTEMFSFTNEGQLLTNNEVISYLKNEEGIIEVWRMGLDEIDRVEQVQLGDQLQDSVYKIYGNSNAEFEWIEIWLSAEEDGDEKFIDHLSSLM